MSCNCCGVEKLFDYKSAQKELKKYKKSGPGRATRKLLRSVDKESVKGKTLLDIGGGIGAIQWHFLKNGATRTTDIDYSDGYVEVAKSFASENAWDDLVQFQIGDFLELADMVEKHDFVTLDKVVCCYPDYKKLLATSLDKSGEYIGLVYPFGGPVAKFVSFLGRIWLKITGNSFRPYIHPVQEIRHPIQSSGFTAVSRETSFPWHVEVYRRK